MPLGAHKAAIMGVAGTAVTGDVVLIESQTASDDTTLDFTSGIDSTYGEYIFGFYNINPASDGATFQFQFNVAGASGFDETITSTFFMAYHNENDAETSLTYATGGDQAQGTAYQQFAYAPSNAADASLSGKLFLFNPSNTTYVKHFHGRNSEASSQVRNYDNYVAGYVNATAAVDEISFKFSTGNFDGTIKMWGVK